MDSPDPHAPSDARLPENDWPEILEWAEKCGQDDLKARFATSEIIAKEAQSTLTVLLAAIGAAAAYGIKIFEPSQIGPVVAASVVLCGYLMAVATCLVLLVMKFEDFPALQQSPKDVMQRGYFLGELKEQVLENLSQRISEAATINDKRSARLNKIRLAAILAPFVFAATAVTCCAIS